MPLPILDVVVSTTVIAVTGVSTVALVETAAPETVNEIQLLLVPLIGALIASGGMIMLNPTPETRRIVIGRAVFSLFLGTVSPQICALLFPSWAPFLAHPVVLLAAGGILSMLFYAVSRPFTERLYIRSKDIADAAVQRAETVLVGKVRENVRDVVTDVVNGKIDAAVKSNGEREEAKARELLATAKQAAEELVAKTAQENKLNNP